MIRKHVRTSTNVREIHRARIFVRTLNGGLLLDGVESFSTRELLFHSFICKCPQGFELDADDKTCIDYNECLNSNHNCSEICVNTEGSYTCSCSSGKLLSSDGKTCEHSNPCSVDNGGCSQICDFHQNRAVCSCRNGFEIDINDSANCNDINECARENK